MNPGQIAFAAFGRHQPAGAAHGERFHTHTLPLQQPDQPVQPNAMTADHHEVGGLQPRADQAHRDLGAGRDRLGVGGHGEESIRLGKRGHRS
jgi:hypothetical protein